MERAASDMQKETRGYLLTGNPVFIDAYKKATSDFYAYQGYLSVLLANESGEVNQLQKIREHLESWLTECAIPCIEAKRSGQDADWLLRADRSEFLMGNLRQAMEQFEAEQMDIYRVRSSAAARERILAATGVSMSPELAAGDYIRIRVRDEGVGIPEERLKRIFDPYFTTKPKGTGLGLATTYSIVRNHSGLITVESELHCGSTFTVYLPAAPAKDRGAGSTGDGDGSRTSPIERRPAASWSWTMRKRSVHWSNSRSTVSVTKSSVRKRLYRGSILSGRSVIAADVSISSILDLTLPAGWAEKKR